MEHGTADVRTNENLSPLAISTAKVAHRGSWCSLPKSSAQVWLQTRDAKGGDEAAVQVVVGTAAGSHQ